MGVNILQDIALFVFFGVATLLIFLDSGHVMFKIFLATIGIVAISVQAMRRKKRHKCHNRVER